MPYWGQRQSHLFPGCLLSLRSLTAVLVVLIKQGSPSICHCSGEPWFSSTCSQGSVLSLVCAGPLEVRGPEGTVQEPLPLLPRWAPRRGTLCGLTGACGSFSEPLPTAGVLSAEPLDLLSRPVSNHCLPGSQKPWREAFILLLLEWSWIIINKDRVANHKRSRYLQYLLLT